MEFGLMWA